MKITNETVKKKYQIFTYDVWGSDEERWVNDVYPQGEVEIDCPVVLCNKGTNREFHIAEPTDKQISDIFGCDCITDGCEEVIYAEDQYGFPIGELRLIEG